MSEINAHAVTPDKLGFSLVELSIVLVILGLLVGGVLSGQSLIRAAELRAVTTEYSRYITAVQSFRDKYFALPGDMSNAVKYWAQAAGGTADGMDAACAALLVASTTPTTCNGDGNGQISDIVYANNGYEVYRSWQHLANAGLIEGSYSGVRGALLFNPNPGTNTLKSKLSNAGYRLYYLGTASSGAYILSNYGHTIELKAWPSAATTLKPEEAWNIDTKLDDGKPYLGIVMSYLSAQTPNCTTADSTSGEYALTQSGKNCDLIMKTGF